MSIWEKTDINRYIVECKVHLLTEEQRKHLDINRYIVECKVTLPSISSDASHDINRYIVECKGKYHSKVETLGWILIDT